MKPNEVQATEVKCSSCREPTPVVALPGRHPQYGFHRVTRMHDGVKVQTACPASYAKVPAALLAGVL